jgi:bifunctional DNase/RNase
MRMGCFWFSGLVGAVLLLTESNGRTEGVPAAEGFVAAEIATLGMDQLSGSPVVVLQEQATGRLLPIWIGPAEAQAIALALEGIPTPRPMTHDLMKSILEESNLRVESVRVEKIEGRTYFGRLVGRREGSSGETADLSIDSRPSDAMALALRLDVPIFVSESLLQEIPEFLYAPGGLPGRLRAFGLEWGEATPAERKAAGLAEDGPGLKVLRRGPEISSDVEEGDLVSEVNGRPVREVADLIEILREVPDGRPLELRLHREGRGEWKIELPLPTPVLETEAPGLQV